MAVCPGDSSVFLLDSYLQEHGRTTMDKNIPRQVLRPKNDFPGPNSIFFSKNVGIRSQCFFNLLLDYFSLFN